MDLFAPRHLLIILVVCLVVFGTKKLKTLGSDLGGAVRGFKEAMKEGKSEDHGPAPSAASECTPRELPAPASAASGVTSQTGARAG